MYFTGQKAKHKKPEVIEEEPVFDGDLIPPMDGQHFVDRISQQV